MGKINHEHMIGHHMRGGKATKESMLIMVEAGYRTMQVMAGNRFRLDPQAVSILGPDFFEKTNFLILYHLPYTVNVVKGDVFYNNLKRDLKIFYFRLLEAGQIPFVVVHPGRNKAEPDKEEYWANLFMEEVANYWHEGYFMLENMAYKYDCLARIDRLWPFINGLGSKHIKMCLDTEHSFASGFHYNQLVDNGKCDIATIKAVHMNAVPPEVHFGKGLDRHGVTYLRDSKDIDNLKIFIRSLGNKSIPMYFERHSFDYFEGDLEFVIETKYEQGTSEG